MPSSESIDHAEKIGVGTYPIFGSGAMLDGVAALNANWFYTWGGQLPAVDIKGWAVGAGASLGGSSADHSLQLDTNSDAWASQYFSVGGNQSLKLSFTSEAAAGSLGGVVLDYLNASGVVIGSAYQFVSDGLNSYTLESTTPSGTTDARLIAYSQTPQEFNFDDFSVRSAATELLQNGNFEHIASTHEVDRKGFIPMVWGASDMSKLTEITKSATTELLTFNEPDHRDQANLTVQQALSYWPELMETGKRLGSPATTMDNTLGNNSWLGRFMNSADTLGYRVDFVAVHYYTTDPSIEKFKDFLEKVHNAYDRPVWVTEWSLADWSNESRFTAKEQQAFFIAATQMMDDLTFVERHSWFSAYDGLDTWDLNTGLLETDGSLTALGESFADLAGGAPTVVLATPILLLPDIATAAGAAPQLAGQALAGEKVTILDGSTVIGSAIADSNGRFDFAVPKLGTGEHSLTAIIHKPNASSPLSAPLVFEVGTAATIAANLDTYATKDGLAAIVITGSHVLPFTSKADMDHARQADDAALSKIVGGYSFAVTTTTPDATTMSSYDMGGIITKSVITEAGGDRITDQFDAAGKVVFRDVFHADTGNHDGHYYAIAGKPYVTQDAVYDSASKLLSMERHYANGVTSFTQVNNADGTTEVHNYDTLGRETSRTTGIASGERDAIQFTYAATGETPTSSFQTHFGPSNTKQWTDQTSANGSHIQTSLAAGTTLASHASVTDVFVGFKSGADTFVFEDGLGKDRIWGFAAGSGAGHDVMRLDTELATNFAAVRSMMTKVGNDTLITFDADDAILVKDVAPTALIAENFHFFHQGVLQI